MATECWGNRNRGSGYARAVSTRRPLNIQDALEPVATLWDHGIKTPAALA
jgi:hypothetical protein